MTCPSTRFSVIIPAYNYANSLRRAAESVLCQLNEQDELIVIDDGSTDDTPRLLAQMVQASGERFRYVRKENGGAASARNLGIRLSNGQFLIFLDADDELLPDALSALSAHLEQHPGTQFIIGGHLSVDASGKTHTHLPGHLPEAPLARLQAYLLDKTLSLSNGACAMHRAIFERGNYPEAFRSAEDIPVFSQALAHFSCSRINRPLAVIHKHADSLRHHYAHARAGGLALVDEVFSPQRLAPEFLPLKAAYSAQRCLSLFRSACLASDHVRAREYYYAAIRQNWRVIFRWAYTKKALRLLLHK